jgi:soluble lytic murein transglycosylase-like protein
VQNPNEQNGLRPAGVRDLLRKPGVRVLLGTVAAVQVAVTAQAVDARKQEAAPAAAAGVAAHRVLPPVVVTQLAMEEPAPVAKVDESETKAKSLAQKYKSKGYPVTEQLAMTIMDAAMEYGIEPEMAFGLVRAESGFRNSATSHVGAIGLTQLMPRTARWLEPGVTTRELRNSETNLRIGMRYLRDLLDKYEGNERLALLAYNRGPGTVDRVLRRGGNPNNGYFEKVMAD